MAEAAYGLTDDRGLTFQNVLNRRLFKIVGGVNFIFMLQDIVELDSDKYTIDDDVYLTIGRRNEMDAEREEGVRLYKELMERRVRKCMRGKLRKKRRKRLDLGLLM